MQTIFSLRCVPTSWLTLKSRMPPATRNRLHAQRNSPIWRWKANLFQHWISSASGVILQSHSILRTSGICLRSTTYIHRNSHNSSQSQIRVQSTPYICWYYEYAYVIAAPDAAVCIFSRSLIFIFSPSAVCNDYYSIRYRNDDVLLWLVLTGIRSHRRLQS